MLVDMHGQNDHTRLHSPAVQLQVLDSYGDYPKELDDYRTAWRGWRLARDRYDGLCTDQGDAQRRRDFLQFQVDEITQAELKPGEDGDLDQERRRLVNAERLGEICASVCDVLYEGEQIESPAGAQVSVAARLLHELAQLDPGQEALAGEAESIRFALEDLSERVRDYADQVVGDPQRLDVVENRLELLRSLKRKYGTTLEEVIATGGKLSAELSDIVNHDSALEEAKTRLMDAEKKTATAGKKLSAARAKAAKAFEKQVQENMRELELPKAVLQIALDGGSSEGTGRAKGENAEEVGSLSFGQTGLDTCEFLVSLNAGEAPKPMRKVASGGEISRIMLAIKSVLADRDHVPTLIFDEIDTGISGQAAARVGEKLEQLAKSHQVMCITHLPQVAARGAMHLVVEKATVNNRTVTAIKEAKGEERTLALARMLSGAEVDDTTRKFAEKLLIR
jgi:DNA repair protein RecN (Recombination protein N)